MKRKSFIVLGLISVMSVGAVGCGGKTAEAIEDTDPTAIVSQAETDTESTTAEAVQEEGKPYEDGLSLEEKIAEYKGRQWTQDEAREIGESNSDIKAIVDGIPLTEDELSEYLMNTYGLTPDEYWEKLRDGVIPTPIQ